MTHSSVQDRILEAAAALLREQQDFTLAEVAARAGLSRGTVYRYAGGRDALLDELRRSGRVGEAEAARPSARDRILDALGARLRVDDFARISIEDVAAEAGVSAMSVYRHFGDRQGLLRAFVEERTPRAAVRGLLERVGDEEDVEAVLTALARKALAFLAENPHVIRLLFTPDPETAALLGPIREAPGRTRAAVARYLRRQMQRGRIRQGDPERLAFLFFGMLFALGVIEGRVQDPEDREAAARLVVRTFLHGHATGGQATEASDEQ